ncbi:MAG: hypothetical protein WKF58_19415 [Ilumatobacteraceae bacterium]
MKALQVSRSVARIGLARVASAVSAGASARLGPLELRTIDPPRAAGRRMAPAPHPTVGDLRL